MKHDSVILTIIILLAALLLGQFLKSSLAEVLKVQKAEKIKFSLAENRR